MKFPKVAQLYREYRMALMKREAVLYKENQKYVDSLISALGIGLLDAASKGQQEFNVKLTDSNGVSIPAPFATLEEFETLVRIVSERLIEWDDFHIKSNWTDQTISVSWDANVYSA